MDGRQDVAYAFFGAVETAGEEADVQADCRLVARAIRRAQAGDGDALAFLYARYSEDVYRYVRSIVRDHHNAEDITQQVFAKLIGVIGKYQDLGLPFLAWVLRVARNVAVDHLRKKQPVPVGDIRAPDSRFECELDRERARDLTDALHTLPMAQREVLVLRHLAGLSPGEIALRTGRTEASIHGLHHRGRRELTAELTSRGAAPATLRS